MFPFLDLKFIKIPMYGICNVIGLTLATILGYFLIKKQKKCFWDFVIISAVAFAFGILFSKILYLLVTFPIKDFFKIVGNIIIGKRPDLVSGGFVFYGGIIGGIIGAFIGKKIAKCKLSDYIDLYGVLIPLVHGFGRIGCFCAGCCYGIEYDGPFSVIYTHPLSTVPVGVGIFPVQLLESFLLFCLSIILLILLIKGKKHVFCYYLISYSVIRFFTEFLRADYERGFILGLSVSQFISIILIILTVVYLVMSRFLKKNKIDFNKI